MKRIRPFSAIAAVTTLAGVASAAGIDQHQQVVSQNTILDTESININIDQEDYSFNTINMDNTNAIIGEDSDEEYENLIHIPIRTRESVLKERNLQHLLYAEYEMDASEIFSKWASNNDNNNNDNGRLLRVEDDNDNMDGNMGENDGHRILQEFSGEGTHFLDAYVGSPAQKRVLAVNSGADFTAFPCEVSYNMSYIIYK